MEKNIKILLAVISCIALAVALFYLIPTPEPDDGIIEDISLHDDLRGYVVPYHFNWDSCRDYHNWVYCAGSWMDCVGDGGCTVNLAYIPEGITLSCSLDELIELRNQGASSLEIKESCFDYTISRVEQIAILNGNIESR